MKKLLLVIIVLFISNIRVSAQCIGGERYKAVVFPQYDSVINLKYGQNVTANSSLMQDLLLDIYLPANDTFQKRPIIFFTHGGSFLSGTKADGDVVKLCKEFAKRGYVCVSQDYRIGMEEFNTTSAARAVWRAMQDARAAIRYMKANADTYKVDTNMIIYGGSSAGGFTALHAAFLDEPNEVLPEIDTSTYTGVGSTGLGNFRGTTNNLPNSSNGIKAVVNLCGAIGDTAWIQAKDSNVVVINMHGTADKTVPYGSAVIKLLNIIPLLEVDGSYSIHKALDKKSHENYFYTYCGSDHVPYAGVSSLQKSIMDSTIQFVARHLYERVLSCGNSNINIRTLVDSTDCPVSGINTNSNDEEFLVFPNPASTKVTLKHSVNEKLNCYIYSSNGRLVLTKTLHIDENTIDISALSKGLYVLKIETTKESYFKKLAVE